jgi:hypothetical protein
MAYQMKPLSCSPSQLKGFSEKLIVSHYENNYGGAVKLSTASILIAPASISFSGPDDVAADAVVYERALERRGGAFVRLTD